MFGAVLDTPYKSQLLITWGRGNTRHSALLDSVKGRQNFLSLAKVTVCCSFLSVMSSDLPRLLVWCHSFVKRTRADLEQPGFQADPISRASIFTTFFFRASVQVDNILKASLRLQLIKRSHNNMKKRTRGTFSKSGRMKESSKEI